MANPINADTMTRPFGRRVSHQGWLAKLCSFAGAATRNYSKTSISWRGNESGGDRSCEGKRPPPSHNHRRVNASTVDLRSIARLWSHYNGRDHMKSEEETESRSVITRKVYIKKEAARYSQYVVARLIVVIIIFVMLLSGRSVDWTMLLNLWGGRIEWHSISRALILLAKLLSCWMHPASCAKELIETLDVP